MDIEEKEALLTLINQMAENINNLHNRVEMLEARWKMSERQEENRKRANLGLGPR